MMYSGDNKSACDLKFPTDNNYFLKKAGGKRKEKRSNTIYSYLK